MVDKKELRKELILKYPNNSTSELLDKAKALKISNRRTDFLAEVRNLRKLPEPSKAKKERSVPIKHRKVKVAKPKPKVSKPKPTPRKIQTILHPEKDLPFEQTKFGKITRDLQKEHGINEKKAIIHARKILKIPKTDYDTINQKDVQILLAHTP